MIPSSISSGGPGQPIITIRQSETSIADMRELFTQYPDLVTKAVKTGVRKASMRVKRQVLENIFSKFKRHTGDLIKSLRTKRMLETNGSVTYGVFVGGKAFYARFLEEGLQAERKKTAALSSFSQYLNKKRSKKYYARERKRPFNMPARPFFDPAAAMANQFADEEIRREVSKALSQRPGNEW